MRLAVGPERGFFLVAAWLAQQLAAATKVRHNNIDPVAARLVIRTVPAIHVYPLLYSLSIVAPMTCVWLANVQAAGGHFAPPPDPEIPIEYSQKPRRHPAPHAYLVSPPPSTQTSSTRPKRRRALAEIRSPNKKRQRGLNAQAHAMSQDSRSPTRKSSRRTVHNAHTIMEETPGAQNLTSAVEHVLLPRQHAVDTYATPRPIRGKRATPPLLPLTDMLTGRAPVLMPRVSEEHASADAGDVEIAEAESTCESTRSTTSRRSHSPTRRMVDLQVAKKPVIPKTATSSADVPQDVRTLYKMIQALARRSKCVIPLGIEVQLRCTYVTVFWLIFSRLR
jgi:hypothetical protein